MSDSTKDKTGRRSRGSMAPPPSTTSSGAPSIHPAIREITEDTPPDLLEGAMELLVVLPSTKTIKINVERRTPMMDLLIHIGTINKLNPGDHIVQVRNERGIELPYKPSTPIGALDTNIIEIVPKNRVSEYIIVKKPAKVANQPFEHTFRLQVHLPRNQLYVMRVSMLAILGDILKEVCQEKNLDINKYEVRHPGNLDERLPLHASLGECGLQSITVVSKNTKISNSVSTADILALQQTDEGRGKGYLDSSFKHSRSSVGDSSVSSGSTRSDKSDRSVSPFPINSSAKISRLQDCTSSADVNHPRAVHKSVSMSNMFSPGSASAEGVQPPPRQKKRAAPPPPPLLKSQTESPLSICAIENDTKETPRKKEAPRAPIVKTPLTSSALQLNQSTQSNHSRHNSENCGYNEDTSVLTKYEYDRQTSAPALLSKQTTARSASNLTTTSSVSNTSLASSTGGSKKRRAPVPPSIPVLRTQSEIEEEDLSEASCLPEVSSSPSKPEKSSCQSSVQVEVDVHYRKNSISVNTSNKEEDNYSSTPASSLSSPGSYISTSSTSSPLPRTESPLCDSKPISLPSRSSIPIDNINSNYSADSDTPCKMQPSEEPVGSTQDSHHDEVDDAGLTSSESEVSYTDSGVPTTETITPSPMDFDARISDHEEDDEPSKHQLNESRGSSNRSSFQSDEEDQWRNVLKEKSMNSLEAQEKTFASMIPQSFETEKNTDKLLSNNEKQSHSTQEKVESGNSSRSSSDSLPPRKLSKAESFSHNSEFDFVQMKRKQFVSGQGKTIDKKRGHSSTDLASSSHHSSSEEDLIRRIDSSHQQNRPRESDSDDYRTISMQNLNTNSSTKEKVEGVQLRNKEGRSSSSIQKSQSLIAIQNTDPEISNNPDLMKAQLEAQFEQWKKDFLKQQEASSVSGQSNTVEPVLDNKHSEIPVETTEMDFVVPIANHSNPKVVAAETEVLPRTFVNIESNVTSSISISSEEPTGILPTEYKYSGPPTIKIGSYTPRTNISVKKDEDYIMGYGQANPKGSPATQSKPATKTRPHSYTPNVAMQKFAPEPLTMVTMRSVVENVTHPNKPIINNSPRGISAILNARPASSYIEEENEESSTQGSVKSVLSTWKQRVADYGSEKKFPEGPPPEIDLYGGGDSTYNYLTSTPSSNLKNVREDKKADVIISNEPKMKIVDGGTTNFSLSKDKFNQSKSFNQPIPTTIISTEQPERKQETNFSKTVFSIAVMESKPAQKPPNKFEASTLKEEIITPTKSENVALRKTQITLELSPSENENNLSLKERKKYFQGIQPVESPGKETPLPAVNMQSSIATIQKVFQQRQQHAPVQRSMTLPSKSNNNVVVEPETTQSSQTPQITTVHTSSTMPKQFQAAMSSTEMVQRVLGKSSKTTHDAFRKTPSPISSTTSTLSRESSSGRETPSSVNEEIVNVRVSNEAKKSEINTHNEGDKSLVIVIGSDTTNKPSPKPITPIGSNNMFKILNNKNATPTKTHFGESSVKRTNSINSTTIIINGNSEKDRRGSKSEKPIVVEQINKSFNNPMAKLKNEGNGPPPPPPPPPNFNIPITRPSEISLKGRPQSVALSSPSSKDSTPSSPNSDPRSEIFSAIKQSNGNFGLKKTGSTFLLK